MISSIWVLRLNEDISVRQQWAQDQWSSHNSVTEHDNAQLLLQKSITGLFLELQNDTKALVAPVGEVAKLRGHVPVFPRLTSYSSAASITVNFPNVELWSRTFLGGSVFLTNCLLPLDAQCQGQQDSSAELAQPLHDCWESSAHVGGEKAAKERVESSAGAEGGTGTLCIQYVRIWERRKKEVWETLKTSIVLSLWVYQPVMNTIPVILHRVLIMTAAPVFRHIQDSSKYYSPHLLLQVFLGKFF